MLRDASPCFLFAGHIVCVDASDIAWVVGETKELVKYAKSFCRFCLGIRVKSSVNPCWSDDDKCLERFCGLYNELLGMMSKIRSLSEFIYGKKEDPFTRALRAFSSWLSRRGHKSIQEYSGNPDNIQQREVISTKLGGSIEIIPHIYFCILDLH